MYLEGFLDELRLLYGRSDNTVDAYFQDLNAVIQIVGDIKPLIELDEGDLREAISLSSTNLWSSGGMGSCQINSFDGTSGPR